jgi:protein-tyrosine phosphatase
VPAGDKVRVLFVCMGNICRSPTAEGVFRHLVRAEGLEDRIHVESAGTHDYHVGRPPDGRAQQAAARRGYDLSAQRARRVEARHFLEFDYVLAMDAENLAHLRSEAPDGQRGKPALFLDFSPEHRGEEVPDPYYGAADGFAHVLDLVEAGAHGLLADIRKRLGTPG